MKRSANCDILSDLQIKAETLKISVHDEKRSENCAKIESNINYWIFSKNLTFDQKE